MKFPTLIPLLALAGLVGAVPFSARAELKLPAIFGDNMVLQQQQRVPVWGWSTPGAPVTVSFAGQTVKTTAAPDGKWLVKLGKLKSSFTPQTLQQLSINTRHLFDEAFIRVLVRRLHAAHEALAHPRRIL